MTHQVFVPVTDDIIYNNPEQIEGPLVPYFAGMECQHWLSIEINPEEPVKAEKNKTVRANNKSSIRLAYSAA